MTIKYFHHLLSQPSRAVYIFLKLTKIPFENCTVNLAQGEHLTEEFKEKYSRFQKVPFIHDENLKLAESIAIVRYLARKYNLSSKWYPKDSKQQAEIDEYLEWQHNNTRAHCSMYFIKKVLNPSITGEKPSPKVIETAERNLNECLDKIEDLWLNNKPYICGDEISVADIFAACEIEQPRMADFEPRKGRPILSAWLDRVREETNPFYDEAHLILNKIAKKSSTKNVFAKL